jgi:hypothetical protein
LVFSPSRKHVLRALQDCRPCLWWPAHSYSCGTSPLLQLWHQPTPTVVAPAHPYSCGTSPLLQLWHQPTPTVVAPAHSYSCGTTRSKLRKICTPVSLEHNKFLL